MYIILKIKCVTQITFTRYFNTIKYKILYGAFSCTTSPIYHHIKNLHSSEWRFSKLFISTICSLLRSCSDPVIKASRRPYNFFSNNFLVSLLSKGFLIPKNTAMVGINIYTLTPFSSSCMYFHSFLSYY